VGVSSVVVTLRVLENSALRVRVGVSSVVVTLRVLERRPWPEGPP